MKGTFYQSLPWFFFIRMGIYGYLVHVPYLAPWCKSLHISVERDQIEQMPGTDVSPTMFKQPVLNHSCSLMYDIPKPHAPCGLHIPCLYSDSKLSRIYSWAIIDRKWNRFFDDSKISCNFVRLWQCFGGTAEAVDVRCTSWVNTFI